MPKTPNLGLYLTADNDTDKLFKTYRSEMSGTRRDSNMNLIDNAIGNLQRSQASPYKLKGRVASEEDLLNIKSPIQNDTYYVEDERCNYTWNGMNWYQSTDNNEQIGMHVEQWLEDHPDSTMPDQDVADLFDLNAIANPAVDEAHYVVSEKRWYAWTGTEWAIAGMVVNEFDEELAGLRSVVAEKYTKLNDTDINLTTSFSNITGNDVLNFKPGSYRAPSATIIGETITYDSGAGYHCAIAPCAEGDTFNLQVGGPAGVCRAWFFVDADMVAITRAAADVTSPVTITAPAGAAYVIVNNKDSVMASGYYAYKGSSLNDRAFKFVRTLNENDDLDNIVDVGWYRWAAGTRPANTPKNAGYAMLVFKRTPTVMIQLFLPITNLSTPIAYRMYATDHWTDYIELGSSAEIQTLQNTVDTELTAINSEIAGLENEVLFPYTTFENGNISPSTGKNSNSAMHPLRSDYIPIDEFVSVDVTGRDTSVGKDYSYQLFVYDSDYSYLGFGSTSYKAQKNTRSNVLSAYPDARFVRIKISGGDTETDLNPSNLADYGYEGLVRVTPEMVERAIVTVNGSDIQSLIEENANENGEYTESFTINFPLLNSPCIVTITAQYTGNMPTIRFCDINSTSSSILNSPYYELGASLEPTRKSWRIPMRSAVYTECQMQVLIPAGTAVDIRDAYIRDDQKNRCGDFGIKFHGHTGIIAPANTVEAFQLGAEIGYNSMITIPKFTTDGIGVCFHDDDSISGALCNMDGSAITGEYDRGVATYTYGELTEQFRIKSTTWGILHVPKLDDFFRVCSFTGMAPILSVHSTGFGTTWEDGFQKIRAMAKKWGVLNKLGIKSGSSTVQSAARAVLGKDIDCYIFLSGQSHAPYDLLSIAKTAGFVSNNATDLSECEYKLVAEYFYAQTVSGATYYAETLESMETESSRGFVLSVATTGTNGISGPEMKRLVGLGVTEFTVDHHISMGLDW